MIIIFLFIMGLAIGSFLNVLIDRLPKEEGINGRSHCDYCKKTLVWYDLVPVVSFITLHGKCRYCRKKLSFFYPFVELVTGAMFVWVGYWTNGVINLVLTLAMVSSLLVIFFADAKYHIIPDSIQVVFFLSGLFLLIVRGLTPGMLVDHLIGAIVVMFPILFLFLLTSGKGMGFGDVKFAFSIGFFLGLLNGLIALYIAFVTGALFGIIAIISKRKQLKSRIAFGPFLVLGFMSALFFINKIKYLITIFYRF